MGDLWYYFAGKRLLSVAQAQAITPVPIKLFNPRRELIWLSASSDFDPVRSLSAESSTGWSPLSKEQMDANAGGLYRIKVDPNGNYKDWSEYRTTDSAKKFEKSMRRRGSRPSHWRFAGEAIPIAQWLGFQRWDRSCAAWIEEPIAGNEYRDVVGEMLESAELLLSKGKIAPPLALIYSAIDMMAWLGIRNTTSDTTRAEFKKWVDEYLLKNNRLSNCTSNDIYGARCGLVHTRTSESSLSRGGGARRILYAFGNRTARELEAWIDFAGETYLAVHVNELLDATREGFERFAAAIDLDRELSAIVRVKSGRMLPTGDAALRNTARIENVQHFVVQQSIDPKGRSRT